MASVCTCLWYPSGAEEAARFYVDLLPESRILKIHPLHGAGKEADPFLVEFQLQGQRYLLARNRKSSNPKKCPGQGTANSRFKHCQDGNAQGRSPSDFGVGRLLID